MSIQSAIESLSTAEAIRSIEFFVVKSDNRGPELHCRLWESATKFQGMDAAKRLAGCLNAAIQPVLRGWSDEQIEEAKRALNADDLA